MRPIADGLFTDDVPPRLLGGIDRMTGRIVFPCPAGERFAAHPLGRHGTVWSFTIQRFRPKSPPYAEPQAFEPFAVAYVELPEVIVEARLTNVALAAIHIGLPVSLTQIVLNPKAADPVLIPAFEPAA